jgi:hypothetical protein
MRLFALTLLLFAAPLAAQNCTYTLSPLQFNITSDSNTGSVLVTGTGACGGFTATSNALWLHIPDGQVTTSVPTRVTFQADANPSAAPRSGAMSIALNTVIVNQAGAICNFGLTPATQNYPVAGGTGTVNIQAACTWQIASDSSWITFPGFIGTNPTGAATGPQS